MAPKGAWNIVKPTLLLCNIPAEKMGVLRLLSVRLGLKLTPVPPERQGLTVEALVNGVAAEAAAGAPFAEELLVLCGVGAGAMNLLLTELHRRRVPIALKAVMTPTNAAWTMQQLHAELCREREAIEKGESAHNQNETGAE